MKYDATLNDTNAGDLWPGVAITLTGTVASLGEVRMRMRRQASAADEPGYDWSTTDGSIVLTASAADAAKTVCTVQPRVLPVPGVYWWSLSNGPVATPTTHVTGILRVRAMP